MMDAMLSIELLREVSSMAAFMRYGEICFAGSFRGWAKVSGMRHLQINVCDAIYDVMIM